MIRRDIWVWLLALTLTVAGFGGAVTSLRGVSAAPTANLTPTVTAPVAVLVTNWALEPSRIGVRLTWSASDSDGSIAQVQLQHSTDGSAWVDEPLISATAMSDAQALTSGVAHVFQVRVQDNAGAWSAWKRGGKFTVTPHQQPRSNPQSSDQVTYYDGTWNTSTHTDFYGDQVCYASALGPRAKFEFQGEGVAWLSTRGFNRGKADVYLDNILVDDDVDLYNDGYLFRRIVFARNGLDASRPHTLEVRPTGAKNAASANTHVDVDEFVVLGAPKLRWAPPTLSSPTTIDLGAACTDTALYNCNLVKGDNNQGKRNYWLTDGRDYRLTLPTDRRVYGEFNISGGRNVVLIGGHLSRPLFVGEVGTDQKHALQFLRQTGTAHVEGIEIDASAGNHEFDGVVIKAPQATLQIQNVRITGLDGREGSGYMHPDIIHVQNYEMDSSGYEELRIDRLTGETNLQGIFFSAVGSNVPGGAYGRATFQNTNLRTTNGYDTYNEVKYLYYFYSDQTEEAGLAVKHPNYHVSFSTSNFIQPTQVNDQPYRLLAPSGFTQSQSNGRTIISWPGFALIDGSLIKGNPPAGDFAPSTAVGGTYVSPGYR